MGKRIAPPICPYCSNPSRLTSGREVYPRYPQFWEKPIYLCELCDAYVGCHPGTNRPLGVPADAATRDARSKLHDLRLDRLWKTAESSGEYDDSELRDPKAIKIIRNTARKRVYQFIAFKLGIDPKDCHTGMFDIETCRRAWTALFRVTYPQIRQWAKERKKTDDEHTDDLERRNDRVGNGNDDGRKANDQDDARSRHCDR